MRLLVCDTSNSNCSAGVFENGKEICYELSFETKTHSETFMPLVHSVMSKAGIKLHLGKGELHAETIAALEKYNAVYAVIPPVTALLGSKTSEEKVVAFPELGMEALHLIKVDRYPAIIGAAHGKSIYTREER